MFIKKKLMDILLERIANRTNYCIGRLYLDGVYFCDTLEDTDRGLDDMMSEEEIISNKIYGQTAIPTGIYKVILNYSPKYKKVMPLLTNVKGYSGIRIHSGNTDKDTLGCILVGENKVIGKLINSRAKYEALYKRICQTKGEIKITIRRKYFVK